MIFRYKNDQNMKWVIWLMGGLLCILEIMFRNAPSVMTHELMGYYNISSTQLGLLVSSYYYPYVILQVPGGIILDLWGVRRMAIFIAAVSTLSFTLFASGISLWTAYLGRVLLGLSAACAFITTLKIVSHWFEAKQFATMSGLTNMMLTIGGMVAGYPLACLVLKFGWQKACFVFSVIGFIWTVCIIFFLKEAEHKKLPHLHEKTFIHLMKHLTRNFNLLRIGLVSACLYLTFSAFAELWAVPYLTTTYNLPTTQAASISVLLYVGAAFGSLFVSPLLRIAGSCLAGLRFTAIAILALFMILKIFYPLHHIGVISIFLGLGIVATGQMLAFSWAHESGPESEQGMRLGFANAVTMIAPIFVQPFMGYLLDCFWTGSFSSLGAKVYTANAYNHAILLFPIFCIIALVLLAPSDKKKG